MPRQKSSRNRHCHSKSGISLPKDLRGIIPHLKWYLKEEAENGFQLRVPKYEIPEDCLWYRHIITVEMNPAVLSIYKQHRDKFERKLRAKGEHAQADALPPIRLEDRSLKKAIDSLHKSTPIKDGVVFLKCDPEAKQQAIKVHSHLVIERENKPPQLFTYNFRLSAKKMSNSVRESLGTADMAKALGVSSKLLLRLRKQPASPFQMGTHYRFQGVTTSAPVRWFPAATDEAFSSFKRVTTCAIETMKGA